LPRLEDHAFSARLDCRYLVQVPDEVDESAFIIALHGYGMDAETMLRLTATWFPNNRIASIQAPHPFYREVRQREVGYSWATHTQSEESVRLHHNMVRHVADAVGAPPERRLLVGFSQSVGLNYRFAATYPDLIHGVIGVCGGLPKNWETGDYYRVIASLFHIARTDDEIYPASATRVYEDRLRTRASDVEFLELPGGHRFPSLAQPAVRDWTNRKFPP
jgi:phospholipase/carboxylesterase